MKNRPKRFFRKKLNSERIGLLFILPNYLIYTVFVLIPVIWTLYLGFTDYNLMSAPKWVGIQNYVQAFQDENFTTALMNTFLFSIFTIFPSMVLGLIAAVLLNNKLLKGKAIFRACYYMPNIISMVAASMVWLWIYDPGHGLLNSILMAMKMETKDWLFDPFLAMPSVILVNIWNGLGYNMIIYLAGLQGIPEYLYEAATVDGASKLRQFFTITIPMIKPITFFLFVMACIKSFQVFDQVFIMTNGGPINSTTTIVHQIYQNAFQYNKMGYASAMALVLLLITTTITLFNFKYGNQESDII
ncbi:carbohydrate ABC transporter membrane protein 1 (CUT1 family) [Hydrogenispora ethanolica]|uniref:Carbohydrate ABC transporter membrane protein 1 (CUT1 family) n=1 Tax=Hydrogenispora ethanolica TaxID=1082276 RepID=A0A4R1QWX3_HYDET|nr:sugar ABC transporter permease [Hydrogenispora ethanolica]TCL57465.1 carbohydrate ABC transporter membrane protein 1 (CUT1 family) [Hydrogenispora ethanolica]